VSPFADGAVGVDAGRPAALATARQGPHGRRHRLPSRFPHGREARRGHGRRQPESTSEPLLEVRAAVRGVDLALVEENTAAQLDQNFAAEIVAADLGWS